MTRAPHGLVAIARAIYLALLRMHPSVRSGYGPQMAATFDALLERAAARGPAAVAALLAREVGGLVATRRPSTRSEEPSRGRLGASIVADARYALRTFRRQPVFTAALIATLALGIGANTAIFSVVKAVLLQRLPFQDPNRLVMVWEDASTLGFPRNTPAPGNYTDWATTIHGFAGVAALDQRDFTLLGHGDPEKIGGAGVTANLFAVLGVAPRVGRTWRADEDVPGNHVAILSDHLWRRRFDADANIVNRTVLFDGNPYTILGVMPPRFETLDPDVEMWVPANFTPTELADRGDHYLSVIARLAPTATLATANAELAGLAERSARAHPETNRLLGMFAVPLLDDYVGDTHTVLIVLLAAVGCVLLVASANVANLLLTRAAGRSREMAIRAALGAGRRRLIRQLMTESLLLSVAGGALGVVIAQWSFGTLTHLVPAALTDLGPVHLDAAVLVLTAFVTMLTGVIFGLAPAWTVSRVELAVAGGRRGSQSVTTGPTPLGQALVVVEIALAMTLLIGAGLVTGSLNALRHVNLGFQPNYVLTARIQLPRRVYADFDARVRFVSGVFDRARALPGVIDAGYTSAVPLVWKGGTTGFVPEGIAHDDSLPYDANNRVVSPGYMETLGMDLRAGRLFDAHDDGRGMPVAIVNARMAREYWPGTTALGRRFRANFEGDGPGRWRTIVGIVDDTCVMGIDQPARPEMYFPIAQSRQNWMWPRDLALRTRADTDPTVLASAVRQLVWSIDRNQPVSNIQSMDDIVARELEVRRTQTTLMSAFAALALVLAAVGIYGVMSYAVTARTSEIGLRLALGGDPRRIRARVVIQGMTMAGLGLALGLLLAYWGAQLLDRLLFHVSPHDWRTFGTQAAVLAVVCLLASYLPARRASRVDPVVALRVD